MDHLNTYRYGLEIRQFASNESTSGMVWIVDVMENGECIIESAGVAGTLLAAMREASDELTHELASQFISERIGA